MASLVPCTACRRHVRRQESQCPFCGAQRQPTAGPVREGIVARDAARATLIALGLTLAGQACGGREDTGERSDGHFIPPYGLSINPEGGSGGRGNGGSGNGGDAGTTGAAGSDGQGGSEVTVPPYGAMPPPDRGSGGDGNAPDSGAPPDPDGADAGSDSPDGDAGGGSPDGDAGD